jgi:ankyrin repeat protein
MTTVALGLDPVFKKFPTISGEAQKITAAVAAVESGARLASGFSLYALACQNLITSSTRLRTAHKELDAALQALSLRVQAATAKIGPSEFLAALRADDVRSVQNMLKTSDLQNKKLSNGEMPLHFAIRSGSFEVVKYLLKSTQINPLSKDHQGLTAFDHAFIKNDRKMIALVLGSTLGTQIPESAIPAKGHVPELRLIIQEIAGLIQEIAGLRRPPVSKLPPLHAAAFLDDLKGLEQFTGSDLNGVDANGMTALHYAVLGGREAVVKWLLAKGAKLDPKASNGMNLLHFAAISGSEAILKRLLDTKKFDLNAADGRGRTPLHFAMASEKIAVARALIERGGDPLAKTMQMTPFPILVTPFAILEVLSRIRSEVRDPLKLDRSSIYMLGSFAASAACHYFGDAKAEGFSRYLPIAGKVLSALPVLGSLYKTSRGGGDILKKYPGGIGFSLALFGYVADHRSTKSFFEGGHSLFLGKTLIDNLRISWKNSALETYRPLRNALVHTVNTLFAAYEFMYTSGIKKKMVCKLGTAEQCILQKDLEPRHQEQPKCLGNPYLIHDEKSLVRECRKESPQEPLSECVPRIREVYKNLAIQCHNEIQNDAELIMGLGGYGSGKTLDEAYNAVRKELSKAGAICDTSKIDHARYVLKYPLPPIETLFPVSNCTTLPPNLDKMKEPEKIAALNPECEDQAEMILGLPKGYTKEECEKRFKALSLKFHPDKVKDPALKKLYLDKLDPARNLICPPKT